MTNRTCQKCGKPSGAYKFCRAHRKENAQKARRRAAATRMPRPAASVWNRSLPLAAPIASEAFYADQPTTEPAKP